MAGKVGRPRLVDQDTTQTVSWRASEARKLAFQIYCRLNKLKMGDVVADAFAADVALNSALDDIIRTYNLADARKQTSKE